MAVKSVTFIFLDFMTKIIPSTVLARHVIKVIITGQYQYNKKRAKAVPQHIIKALGGEEYGSYSFMMG
jgi:hypothetical protein